MDQLEILRHVVSALEQTNIQYMLVGSYGSSYHGEPRLTYDIDVLVDMHIGQVSDFCERFPISQYYVSEAGLLDAIQHRFQTTIIHHNTGNKVDLIFPKNNEWGNSQLARRQRAEIANIITYVADPIDIIIAKMWYYSEGGSDKHLRDVASMLRINPDRVNVHEVKKWADQLGYTAIWETILQRVSEQLKKEQPYGNA